MGATVIVNMRTVVHKDSGGKAIASAPDVCKTPSPGGPVPIPYPNIAQSSDTAKGSKKVKMDGNPIMLKDSEFSTSMGDEAGTAGGGIVSSKTKGKAKFVVYSFDVKVEGKNVPRLGDAMTSNGNTPNDADAAEAQSNLVVTSPEHDIKCAIQKCDKKDENGNDYDITKTKKGKKMPACSRCGALGSKKHTCVKRTLEKKKTQCNCEQTFDMRPPPPNPVDKSPGKGLGRRPDVIVGDPKATPRNIDVYDAKFPCTAAVKGGKTTGSMPSRPETATTYLKKKKGTAKEFDAYKKIAGKGKVKPLTPEDCKKEDCEE